MTPGGHQSISETYSKNLPAAVRGMSFPVGDIDLEGMPEAVTQASAQGFLFGGIERRLDHQTKLETVLPATRHLPLQNLVESLRQTLAVRVDGAAVRKTQHVARSAYNAPDDR